MSEPRHPSRLLADSTSGWPKACSSADLEDVIRHGNRTFDIEKLRRGEGEGPNWFRLGDGTVISVIAGGGAYSLPRGEDGPFTHVEVWWEDGEDGPTGYVEVERLRYYVESHGGVVAVARDEQMAKRPTASEKST